MDPITVTAITSILSYWGGKAIEKAFDTAAGEFTKESISWFKSLFFKDGKPTEVLTKYEERPDSNARQNAVKATIESEIEDNPKSLQYLKDIVKGIEAKSGNTTNINKSKNVVSESEIKSGGHTVIGDNNRL